jgi:hypothetical protein
MKPDVGLSQNEKEVITGIAFWNYRFGKGLDTPGRIKGIY